MMTSKRFRPFVFLACFIFCVSLACGSSTPTPTGSNAAGEKGQSDPVNTPVPTNLPEPTNTPKPANTPTAMPIGLGRSQPFPRTEVVPVPNWEVQLLEVMRGDEAWSAILAANQYNDPAPEGMEYLLLKLHVKSTYTDSDEHTIGHCDFDVTGDRLILYSCLSVFAVTPEPQLDATLFTGGETEGWVAYVVGKDERNLILIVDEGLNFDDTSVRYIAIDDGASLSVSPDFATISPTNLGTDRMAPAPKGEKLISDDWEITILESIRGEEAWNLVQAANQFNDPPEAGREFILVKVHARNISTEDEAQTIDFTYFTTTGSANEIYDAPWSVAPEPILNTSLFPGGETEGWIVVQAAISETGVNLIFAPLWDFSGNSKRYISLE